jgi:hypothetical protein
MPHDRKGRKLTRQLPPLAGGPHHIEQRLDTAAYFSVRWRSQLVANPGDGVAQSRAARSAGRSASSGAGSAPGDRRACARRGVARGERSPALMADATEELERAFDRLTALDPPS